MYSKPMSLKETLAQNRGVPPSEGDDLIGVEVELEGKHIMPIDDKQFNKYWEAVPDGSLKVYNPDEQAIEYRFKNPLNLSATEKALEELQFYLTKKKVEIFDSGRTSVHVHINCNNETMAVIYNYLTLSVIFDELLVSQNGPRRIGNNFCLRAKDAEGFIVSLSNTVHTYGNMGNLSHNNRYSSINPMSLFKFGSIEFRSMECTVDRQRLVHWVKTLLAIKNAARTYANPAEIMGAFSQLGPERFFLNTLGPQAIRYMRVTDRHQMLFQGLRLVQEFANSATWEPWVEPPPRKKRPVKSLMTDQEIQEFYGVQPSQPLPVPTGSAWTQVQMDSAIQAQSAQQAAGLLSLPPGWGNLPEVSFDMVALDDDDDDEDDETNNDDDDDEDEGL